MGALQIAKKRRQRHFYIGGSCRMTRLRLALRAVAVNDSIILHILITGCHIKFGGSCRITRLRLALRVVAAGGSVVSLRSTRTCSRCTRLILRLTLRANAIALFKIVPDNFVESCILQIAKKRCQRHFYIGGSCRMTRLRLALRAVAAGGSVVSLRSTRTCCRFESFISQIAKKRL